MIKTNVASGKILRFVVPQAPTKAAVPHTCTRGQLENWFRGVVQSNHDLVAALEQLRNSYKGILANKALTEADRTVLTVVETALNGAKKVQKI